MAVSVIVAGAITSVFDSASDTVGFLLSCVGVPDVTITSAVDVDAPLSSTATARNL